MNREEVAWAGGLFDGEGCWGTYMQAGTSLHRAGASLVMTDQDSVRRFARAVGFGTVRVHEPGGYRQSAWRWESKSFEGFQALVAMLWPWVNKRRRKDAMEDLLLYAEERLNCSRDAGGKWRLPRELAQTPGAIRQRRHRVRRAAS